MFWKTMRVPVFALALLGMGALTAAAQSQAGARQTTTTTPSTQTPPAGTTTGTQPPAGGSTTPSTATGTPTTGTPGTPSTGTPTTGTTVPPRTPAPYQKEEFAPWLLDLRRAEVIFFGSLPFTYFFNLEGYDLYRFASKGFDSAYAPWPLRAATEITYSTSEQIWLIAGTLTASLSVAVTDFLIHRFFDHREDSRRENRPSPP